MNKWEKSGLGAASGAASGAAAGSGIYPGIGTGIGAAVGAIGGFLSGILGGDDEEPTPEKPEANFKLKPYQNTAIRRFMGKE
jgi:outer membrane lipoprotein SlyB